MASSDSPMMLWNSSANQPSVIIMGMSKNIIALIDYWPVHVEGPSSTSRERNTWHTVIIFNDAIYSWWYIWIIYLSREETMIKSHILGDRTLQVCGDCLLGLSRNYLHQLFGKTLNYYRCTLCMLVNRLKPRSSKRNGHSWPQKSPLPVWQRTVMA